MIGKSRRIRSAAALLVFFAVCGFFPAEGPAAGAEDLLEVAVMPGKGRVALTLAPDTPALVEETREVHLEKGRNRLRFDWSGEKIDPASVRLSLSPPEGGAVERTAVIRPGRSPRALYFDVQSTAAGEATATVSYLLSGIGWKVRYLGFLDETEERLDLAMTLVLSNKSGMDLEGASVSLPFGAVDSIDLKNSAAADIGMLRAGAVPVEKRYTYDLSKYHGKVALHIRFRNDEDSGLGRAALPSGKIRLFRKPAPGAAQAMVGEDILPFTARGEEAKVYVGNATDITVERKVLKSVREKERRDRWNKVTAFDQRERLRFKVANHKDEKASLRIVEHIVGSWEMVEKGRDFEKKDAGTIEYVLDLEAGGEETFEVEYVRNDLW